MTSLVKKNVGHALLIPYPSQGHINPMLQFGKRICSHGRSATAAITRFISATTTPDAGKVSLETISDGFDEDGFAAAESISAYLASLESVGSQTLDALLQSLADRGRPVSVVVYDSFLPWTVEVARRHGAAAAAFFTQSVAVDVIYCHVWEGRLRFPVEAAVEKLQGLPRLEPEELPSFISAPAVHYAAYLELVLNQYKNLEDADFMLINSFYELEHKEMDWMMSVRTARTVGPTVPSAYLDDRIPGDSRYAIHLYPPETDNCRSWAAILRPGSAIFVSFGSMAELVRVLDRAASENHKTNPTAQNSSTFTLIQRLRIYPTVLQQPRSQTAIKSIQRCFYYRGIIIGQIQRRAEAIQHLINQRSRLLPEIKASSAARLCN